MPDIGKKIVKAVSGALAAIFFAIVVGLFFAALAEAIPDGEAAANVLDFVLIFFPTQTDTALELGFYLLKTIGWGAVGAFAGWNLRQ